MPDHILIVRADRINAILENKPEYYFEKIKINDKSFYSLSDTHGSAFIPINANVLAQETDGFWYLRRFTPK